MDPIILITVDCLRSDHVGCYGYDRDTSSNIDNFADSATIYENAYANCPGTRWAFQSLHTGVPTIQIDGLGIPAEIKPLASRFKELGYRTGGFAVNGFVSREYDYDTGFDTFYSVADTTSKIDRQVRDLGKYVNETLDNEFVRDRILFPVYNHLWSSDGDDERQFMPDHSDVDTVDHALRFIAQHRDESYFLWVI